MSSEAPARINYGHYYPRTDYGKYQRLKPLITKLYVEHGIPSGLIAISLGLRNNSLSSRIAEWGLAEERERFCEEQIEDTLRELASEYVDLQERTLDSNG